MATKKKMLQAAAGQAGGAGLDITEVFSTYLYEGNGSALTITNGIDLAGEGGLVWFKNRDVSSNHRLVDTERGMTSSTGGSPYLYTNSTVAEQGTGFAGAYLSTSTGFDITSGGATTDTNDLGNDYASWTFRKAPKFFDVVTYTGDGNASKTISHSLGSTPGFFVCKPLNQTGGWRCFHRSTGNDAYGQLNENYEFSLSGNIEAWAQTSPTDTNFTVGISNNTNNINYVAYLFAHNNGDGGFGPSGDQDIIKCGSYTGNASNSAGPIIDLGFEPQWVMIKSVDSAYDWFMADTMRGWTATHPDDDNLLRANTSGAETANTEIGLVNSTGFQIMGGGAEINGNGQSYIYMAIRRGPLAQPESGTEVFAVDVPQSAPTTPYHFVSGFPVDLAVMKANFNTSDTYGTPFPTRLLGSSLQPLNATSTAAEGGYAGQTLPAASYEFDHNEGFFDGGSIGTPNDVAWMFRRAPGFFDVVAYTGTGSARTVSHNLGVAPEMMWVKCRNTAVDWAVYHHGLDTTSPEDYYLYLNDTIAKTTTGSFWGSTAPTDLSFSVAGSNRTNDSGNTYIAYLFATLPGVSKVGSYTGNGSSQVIDCGFTSGARFVLIKRTDSTGDWVVFDTERGIGFGNDPFLELNTTDAENTSSNIVGPNSGGFNLQSTLFNGSGETYIFYAIA